MARMYPDQATAFFDVDDTLVKWYATTDEIEEHGVYHEPTKTFFVPHKRNIRALKDCKNDGYVVVVWSQGGTQHAHNVLEAFDLLDHVDVILCKPTIYCDDLPPSAFMTMNCWRHDED